MLDLPQLPTGPVRLVAAAGTLSLVAFAFALAWELRPPPGGRAGVADRRRRLAWAAAALALAVVTMAAGRRWPLVHAPAAVLVLAVALRNAWKLRPPARVASGVAAVAWLVAVLAARAIF